jgi:hypothetical protein
VGVTDDDGDSGYVATDEWEPDDNYLAWLADQQIRKQDEGELEDRAGRVERVRLDFRGLGPREPNGESRKPLPTVDTSKSIDAADLIALTFDPLKWIVPDLMPEGMALLVAPPKIGKSSLVYQLCTEIACGGSVLNRACAKGSVLYLALEDSPRRGKAKLLNALAGRPMPRGRLTVWWNAPNIGAGLEERIEHWIETTPDPVLVAIDTLERVRPESDPRQNAYRTDVKHISTLYESVRNTNVALLVVHHARKQTGDDFVQAVSGTYGLTGSVDTIISIERKRNDQYAVIKASGREVAEVELPARMDDVGLWHYASEALAAQSEERLEVFQIIEHRGPIWPQQVARIMGREDESGRVSVQQMMSKLKAEGVIVRGKSGYSVSRSTSDYSAYAGGEKTH